MAHLSGRILELDAEPQMDAKAIAAADPEVEDVHTFGEYLHLRVGSAAGPLKRIPARLEAANIHLSHLHPVPATLEDVFIHLLETEGADYVEPSPSA